MADDFEKRYQAAKKKAEDPRTEMDEQMGRAPAGSWRKAQSDFQELEKERAARSKKDPFVK